MSQESLFVLKIWSAMGLLRPVKTWSAIGLPRPVKIYSPIKLPDQLKPNRSNIKTKHNTMRFFSFQNNLFIDSCAISSHYQDIDLATMFIFDKWTFYQPKLKIFSWNLSWHYHSILEIVRHLKSHFQGTSIIMRCVHTNNFLT